ncbi:MAG: sigma-70 family RNA polymerase sigma factor [Kiritimatiellae bacterium]|nr:sigma-70 family RNA polymerase sigma factor [Kiritimatiellia bacterium]
MSEDIDSYECYAREISQYPRISPDREMELSRIILESDDHEAVEAAVQELVEANLLLVMHCVKDFEKYLNAPGVNVTRMDLIAEGNIALMQAARRFDAQYRDKESEDSREPVRFSTYACKCIKNRLRRAVRLATFIHVPENHFACWSRMRELEEEYGADLTDKVVLRELDITPERLSRVRCSRRSRTMMLEDLLPEDNDSDWSDIIASEDAESPEEEACREDLREYLQHQMEALPARTQRMMSLMFLGDHKVTLEELSHIFGVSRERCRQVCAKGLRTLRRKIEASPPGQRPVEVATLCNV